MKIYVTADLHLGITTFEEMKVFSKKVAKLKPDYIVIGGDIAECRISVDLFDECLKFFTPIAETLVIPGNHDLWVGDDTRYTPQQLWNHELQSRTEKSGAWWLETSNFYTPDKIAIVGSYLHYDYSAKDTVGVCSGMPVEYWIKNKAAIINDGNFMKGLPDDIQFAHTIKENFLARLSEVATDWNIIVITHVPCMESQITRKPHDLNWSIATPFFGNLSCMKNILDNNQISHVISGHSHKGNKNIIERGQMQPLEIINLDSDYHSPKGYLIEL